MKIQEREIGALETPFEELTRTYRSMIDTCSFPQAMRVNNLIQEATRSLRNYSTIVQEAQQ